ncbi:MAG: BamA/TamA family outer membrane protein [Gemmatimonadota bacterium]
MTRFSPLAGLLVTALLLPAAVAGRAAGLDPTAAAQADSLAVDGRPQLVHYRSRLESALALPGRVVYAPLGGVLYVLSWSVSDLYERHALDHMKELLTTADGRIGVRPLANTGIGTGFRLFHRDFLAGADWDLTSSFGRSVDDRQHHLLELAWHGVGRPGRLLFTLDFSREPDESYYGIGNGSLAGDRTRFRQEETRAQLVYRCGTVRWLIVTARIEGASTSIGAPRYGDAPATTGVYPGDQLLDLAGPNRVVGAAVALQTSLVDVRGSPTHGNNARLDAGLYRDLDGSLSYASFNAVTEQFFELFYRRTASLRLGLDWRPALGGGEVPVYSMASVGGNLFVRGYQRGRFRDRGAAFGALIYRFPVARCLDGGVFYESGRTFRDPADLSLGGWHDSYGGGLRIWVPKGLVFQLLAALSDEEHRILFSFSTDF